MEFLGEFPALDNLPAKILLELMRIQTISLKSASSQISREIEDRIHLKPVKNDSIVRACLILYHDDDSTDDRILLDDEEILVHKYVLAANSPQNRLPISGTVDLRMVTDVKAFHYLVKFMYILEFMEGEEPIGIEDAHAIWQCGMLFLDEKDRNLFAQELCRWFSAGLNGKSVFKVLQATEEKGYALCLRDAALGYIINHFSELSVSTQFQTLPKNILLSLVQKLGGVTGTELRRPATITTNPLHSVVPSQTPHTQPPNETDTTPDDKKSPIVGTAEVQPNVTTE